MKADKRAWMIGILILLAASIPAYAFEIPKLIGGASIDSGFFNLAGRAFVNGLLIFALAAGIANAFSMFEDKQPQKGTIMYILMFTGALIISVVVFGDKFIWEHELIRQFFNLHIAANSAMILALAWIATYFIPQIKEKREGSSKGAQAGMFIITAIASVAIARYLDAESGSMFLWQMPWFSKVQIIFKNIWVFVGMGIIYYLVFGLIENMDKKARGVLAAALAWQAATQGWTMYQVWSTGYLVSLLFIWKSLKGSGNLIACGMSFAISNLWASAIPALAESNWFIWIRLIGSNFLVSFLIGAGIGLLMDKAIKSDIFKFKKDWKDIEEKKRETEEKWSRRLDAAKKGLLKKLKTEDPKDIEYLYKDMEILEDLVKQRGILLPNTPQWNRLMYGAYMKETEAYPTIEDYSRGYENLKKRRAIASERIEQEEAKTMKFIKKDAKELDKLNDKIEKEREKLREGKINASFRLRKNPTATNPVYSSNLKTIMGITMHTELEIKRIMEEQEERNKLIIP